MYRHSTEVVGAVYFADIYCAECAEKLPEFDCEGNPKSPLFLDALDEFHGYNCAECASPTSDW